MTQQKMMNCSPVLPHDWRERLAQVRQVGYLNTPQYQQAHRIFVQQCFPAYVDATDADIRDQLEAWWVLMQLPYDGVWQYWLTVEEKTS